METVAIIADAADIGGITTEMGDSDDRVGDRSTANEFQVMLFLLEAFEELELILFIDELHAAALESERLKFGFVDFEEDIDDGIAKTADVKFSHAEGAS